MDAALRPVRVRAHLAHGMVVHLWLKSLGTDGVASVSVEAQGQTRILASTAETAEFTFFEASAEISGWVDIVWRSEDTAVSYIYAFDPRTVLKTGIAPIFIAERACSPLLSESYHFRPPLGWMNDPNGFCQVGETFHLFYQHYPHAQRWSAMHWGHATSRDMINWVHQPILLRPEPEMATDFGGLGGVFSGSAIPLASGDGLRVFFTDSLPNRLPAAEFQRSAVVPDGVRASPSEIIVDRPPPVEGLRADFRDPYVFVGPDGRLHMVVGGRDERGGAVLLFRTEDPEGASGWEFQSVLHRDDRMGMTVAECPCLAPVGGTHDDPQTRWVLIYAQLDSVEPETGRRNLTTAIVGRFDGQAFRPSFESELDFAAGAYAFQAFAGVEGAVGIAWLANWHDWDRVADFSTAMTLPRRLLLSEDAGALLTPPIDAVLSLRGNELENSALLRGGWVALANGAAEIRIALAWAGAAFRLEIDHPVLCMAVAVSADGVEIVLGGMDRKSPRYVARGARPSEVRVFLDTGSIEVFADGGRWTGTRRIAGTDRFTGVRLVADPGAVTEIRAWDLRRPAAAPFPDQGPRA